MCLCLAMSVCMHVCRSKYAGERIPTLQEALALCKELDLIAFVEVKSNRLLVSVQNLINSVGNSTVICSWLRIVLTVVSLVSMQ